VTQRLITGHIVWAEIADPNGHRKLRPAVIVTPTDQVATSGPLEVVAVTSRLEDPLPADHVLLPWHELLLRHNPFYQISFRCLDLPPSLPNESVGYFLHDFRIIN